MNKERIDKILSHHGFGTRKDVKKMLRNETVTVNGSFVYDPGFQIDISKDTVAVDGEIVKLQHDLYIMLNKCKDVVCANKDGEHKTVFDLLDDSLRHKFLGGDLHCMGRLDIDTEGLLILTTDGKLTHKLLAPKTHVPKTYAVGLRDSLTDEQKSDYIEKFSKGFWIDREQNEDGFDCQPSELVFISDDSAFAQNKSVSSQNESFVLKMSKNASGKIDCLLTIYEGKFHQVKRMFAQVGNEVIYLKRVKMGNLELDSELKLGEYRELSEEEIGVLSFPCEN